MTNKTKLIIRFSDQDIQPSKYYDGIAGHLKRVIGYVPAKSMLPIFDCIDLDANPRSSKVGNITDDILDTLNYSQDLFPFKSKGILIGCAKYRNLERNRYELEFTDLSVEGILDGGHNMLAIGLHLLREHMAPNDFSRIKFWDEMKNAWRIHRTEISNAIDRLGFLVSVELLLPTNQDEDTCEQFSSSLLDICAARNNNAQLVQEAKANKRGFYDHIKSCMCKEFSDRVEWRPNTWEDAQEKRPIKVRDLVAYAWLPLNVLNESGALPVTILVTPQNIYRNKGECSSKFNEIMAHCSVTKDEGAKSILIHEGVKSAFKLLADLPMLYDDIYERFPEAYNAAGRKFGASPIVKIYDPERRRGLKEQGKNTDGYISTQPTTPMFRKNAKYRYPEGLIAPLFYGLTALMKVHEGKVVWDVNDPRKFLKDNLPEIAEQYKLVLDMGNFDPQKISKNPSSHEFSVQQFRSALLKEKLTT